MLPEGDTRKQFGKFDLHFWVDWGEDGLPWQEWYPPKDGGKTIYVASDTHLDGGYRLKKAERFDHAFFNQQAGLDDFVKREFQQRPTADWPISAQWLPHAAEPLAYPRIEILKKYDLCFIGHVNGENRIEALDRMFREFPNFYYGARHPAFPGKNLFEDAAKRFSESRIVFNISVRDDINMRAFETLSTGSFLLTNALPTLGELFEDGKHLVTYTDLDDAVEKARYYLQHDDEREAIARAGHDEQRRKHTYDERVKTILKTVGYDD